MIKKVSIIMPSYNSSKFIREAIESVLLQTYTNWELLIVDDCSIDDTYQIIKRYSENDNRIRVYQNNVNKGAAFSRNFAIEKSVGDYIAFLDSDDKWHADKLKKQIEFMTANNYVFTYTNYLLINEQGNSLNKLVCGPRRITHKMMLKTCYPGCLTVVFEKNAFSRLEVPNSIKKRNDYALWLLLSKEANCYLLEECLACYRKVDGSISSGNKVKLIKHHVKLFKTVLKYSTFLAYYRAVINIIYYFFRKFVYVKKTKNNFNMN